MARKIVAYSLLALGLLGAMFFNGHVENVIPYSPVFMALCVIIGALGLVLLFTTRPQKKVKEEQQRKQHIADLKANGAHIVIDLADCEILEHSYTEEHESRPLFEDIAFADLERLVPEDDNVVRDKTGKAMLDNVTQSVLIYKKEINGRHCKCVSQVIRKDKATLMFLLDAKKHAILYYDKNDPCRCYFDLGFPDE